MDSLSLTVRFPLGIYYGHKSDQSLDFSPSPARLHAALLHSAATGSCAEGGQPSAQSLAALEWLELNPPSGLFQPETRLTAAGGSRFMYRDVGTVTKSGKSFAIKKEKREVSDGIAIDTMFGFQWDFCPADIAEQLTLLAEDVGCLGETHSVAIIERADFTPNIIRDVDGHPFKLGGLKRDTPAPGRTKALTESFNAIRKENGPSVSSDKAKLSDKQIVTQQPTSASLGSTWYKAVDQSEPVEVPWEMAYLFKLDRPIAPAQRVEASAALHRGLISRIGRGAAPVITGKYLDPTDQPANRLAIHYLPRKYAQQFGVDHPSIVLFVPPGLSAEELEQIRQARNLTHLWSRRLKKVKLSYANVAVRGDEFWPAPEKGMLRLWRPLVPIIPETRRVKGDQVWSLADSGLLSIAYVWREQMTVTGKRAYRSLRDEAESHGARVFRARTFAGTSGNYVHNTHKHVPVQPYTALFDLGDLASPTTVSMLGQSRHLGGGLLAPHDIPNEGRND